MWCLVVFQHDLHGQYLPQSKGKLLLKNIVCLKGRSWPRVHSHGIARNKYYGVITKRMNFNSPIVVSSECFEPNENDLKLNAVAYTFSKIFQPERTNFNSSFGDRELLTLVRFPWEATAETKKKITFSAVEDFNSCFSHDVTKIRTTKLLILLRFYLNDELEQLKTNIHTNFRSEWVFGFVIHYAWISELLRDAAFTWRPRELSWGLKKVTYFGELGYLNSSSIILIF